MLVPIRIQSSLTVGTNKRICLPRPSHGSLHRFAKVHLAEPFVLLLRELAVRNLNDKLVRPLRSNRVWLSTRSTNPLLGDGAVPDMVQVVVSPIPLHVNPISTTLNVLVMQWLVQIFDEMQNKLRCLHAPPRRELGVESLGCIVCEGSDDAAVVLAVAF